MSNDISKHEFTTGADVGPEEDLIYWSSGITDNGSELWLDRIQCFGKTREEARALRDRVLRGLDMVDEQEREVEQDRLSFEHMQKQGLIAVGTAKVGSQVISAGLGEKTTMRMSNEYKVKGDD